MLKTCGEINKLVAFELDLKQLIDWSLDIKRLMPDVEPEHVQFILDCYKLEKLVWDERKGIQNIFSALKLVAKNERGYYLRRAI